MEGVEGKYQAANSVIFAQWYLRSVECGAASPLGLLSASLKWVLVNGVAPNPPTRLLIRTASDYRTRTHDVRSKSPCGFPPISASQHPHVRPLECPALGKDVMDDLGRLLIESIMLRIAIRASCCARDCG
jgi:hypothetical protein